MRTTHLRLAGQGLVSIKCAQEIILTLLQILGHKLPITRILNPTMFLYFPNSWCQKGSWNWSMSAKQELRRRTAGPTQFKILAAAPPVIDHAGPQVSNNLSWHFIQAADQRGSGISGAWNSQSLEAGRARIHRWILGRAPIRRTRSAIWGLNIIKVVTVFVVQDLGGGS